MFTRPYLLIWLSLCGALGTLSGALALMGVGSTGGQAWSLTTFAAGLLCGVVAYAIWRRNAWAFPVFLVLSATVMVATLIQSGPAAPNTIVRLGIIVGSAVFLWRAAVGVRRATKDAA